MTVYRKGLHEILDNGSQAARNLNAVSAAMANLGERQVYEIFPVRRPQDHPQVSGLVQNLVSAQMSPAGSPQQTVKLIYRQYRRRRVIDRRRQCFEREVHYDAIGKGRVLLDRAFWPERDRCAQITLIDCGGAAVKIEQRLVHANKIADLRDEFDHAV